MRRTLLSLFLAASLPAALHAQSAQTRRTEAEGAPGQFLMLGAPDCAQWLRDTNVPKSWLVGFLSGRNSRSIDPKTDPLAKLSSSEQAFLWMDNYCKANPLKNVGDGGLELYGELQQLSLAPLAPQPVPRKDWTKD